MKNPLDRLQDPTLLKTDAFIAGDWVAGSSRFPVHDPATGYKLADVANLGPADAQAAIDALEGPVFVAGYCWGGAASWVVAANCEGVAAASCFYGRRISERIEDTPRCPTILHFGKTDASIPMERVDEIRARHPEIPIYLYDAGHGFVSDRRKDYQPDAARLARLRTLQLFARSGGGRGEGA